MPKRKRSNGGRHGKRSSKRSKRVGKHLLKRAAGKYPSNAGRGLSLVPPMGRVALKYSDEKNLSCGTETTGQNLWRIRMNGLFDPDFETGGHQPMGYDQCLSATGLYTLGRVTAVEWSVVFINLSNVVNTQTVTALISVGTKTDSPLNGITSSKAMEEPNVIMRRVQPSDGPNSNIQRFRGRLDIKKRTKRLYGTEAWTNGWTVYSANPTYPIYLQVGYLRGPETGQAATAVDVIVKMKYMVELRNPVYLAQS